MKLEEALEERSKMLEQVRAAFPDQSPEKILHHIITEDLLREIDRSLSAISFSGELTSLAIGAKG